MKKKLVFLLISSISYLVNAQNLIPDLTGTFIEGVSSVNNNFTYDDGGTYPSGLLFEAINNSGSVVDSYTDNTPSGTSYIWNGTDMGALDPGSTISVTDISSNSLLETLPLTIIAKPNWMMNGGTASAGTISGNIIPITCTYPVATIPQSIPSSVTGIGGSTVDLANCNVAFTVDYDFQNDAFSNIASSEIVMDINTMGQSVMTQSIPFSGLSIDPQFNLAVDVQDSIDLFNYDVNFPSLKFPVCPFISVKVDAGISILADVKGQVYLTQNGFDVSGTKITKVVARLKANGFVRGEVNVLFGAGSASGSLNVNGRVGIGMEYTDVSSSSINPLFGGDLIIDGQVDIVSFWGLGPSYSYNKTFYTDSFGDYSAVSKHIASSYDPIFNSKSRTYNINGTLVLPNEHPMPSFGTRDNLLYTTWIEQDANGNGYLLLNRLDTNGGCFANEVLLANNDFSMSNPKIGIMPSGKAVIVWSQSRYNSSNLPSNLNNPDSAAVLLNSQDVWVGLYDTLTNTISTYIMGDDMSTLNSGRAEGEPKIAMGSNNQGLITWVSKDPVNLESDILFATVTENSNALTIGSPTSIYSSGVNKDVHVSYVDNTNAIAVWINDPDGDEETLNNNIMYSEWNGATWNTAVNITTNPGDMSYDELSIDYNADFCGLAWSSTIVNGNNDFEKRVDVQIWDNIAQQWDQAKEFYDTDSMYYFQKPRITISDQGIACLSYQVIDMFPDPNYIDPGQLNLYLNDLNAYQTNWAARDGNTIVADTNNFIWYMDAGFGNNNVLYTITQEYGSSGPISNPSNGILFGDASASMVFRAIEVDNSLNLINNTEPNCNVPVGIISNPNSNKLDFELLQNYPNPVRDQTQIEFRIKKDAHVTLTVKDIYSRTNILLLDNELGPGIYQTKFEPKDLADGVYFYTLTIGQQSISKKMVIIK